VEEDPAAVEEGEGRDLLAGAEGGDKTHAEADREEEDAEGDGFIAPVDEKKGEGEEEAEEGLGLVGVYGKGVVGGVEHLGERDEVEEDGGDGGGDGDVTPAGTVVEGGGQDRERGDAVEKDRDSEPEEGHKIAFACPEDCESSVYRVWLSCRTGPLRVGRPWRFERDTGILRFAQNDNFFACGDYRSMNQLWRR
jgi:hypothetical protein